MAIQIGSWGTPELGITEKIGDLLGWGRTAQGGSNMPGSSGLPTAQVSSGGSLSSVYGPGLGWAGQSDTYSPQVLGTSTSNPTGALSGALSGSQGSSNGSSGSIFSGSNQTSGSGSSGPSIEDILNQGYNDYSSQLDQMLEGLSSQSNALTSEARSSAAQQQADLDLQRQQGEQTLNQYQTKTLRDLSSNIRNQLNAGNIMLGAQGAGDSSAGNMYSYALNKFGTQQRTNVMEDVSTRLGNLQQLYNSETNKLKSSLDQKVSEISRWFSEQQNALRGQKASLAQQRSQQLLDFAVQQLNNAQQQAAQQRSILDQWAANNATNLTQLKQQLASNSSGMYAPSSIPTLSFGAKTSSQYYGGNNSEDEKKGLFG